MLLWKINCTCPSLLKSYALSLREVAGTEKCSRFAMENSQNFFSVKFSLAL